MAAKQVTVIGGTRPLWVKHSRAETLVRQGRAEYIGNAKTCIRMHEGDYRHRAAMTDSELGRRCADYDIAVHVGCINQRQAKGIPFAGNLARLGLSA